MSEGQQSQASTPAAAAAPHSALSDFPFAVSVAEIYDGPLDLLLDLIRKQDIDIYDIPIARITAQFLAYVQSRQMDVDTAAEFIYVASLLIHIKSKMLLPRDPAAPAEEEGDPRQELVARLLEHEKFKSAAQMLLQKQQIEEAMWSNPALKDFKEAAEASPEIAADTVDLVRTFQQILERAKSRPLLEMNEDSVTVGHMIDYLRRRLMLEERPLRLKQLLQPMGSQKALVCAFLALLELVRLQAIALRQERLFGDILVKKHVMFDRAFGEGEAAAVRDDWK